MNHIIPALADLPTMPKFLAKLRRLTRARNVASSSAEGRSSKPGTVLDPPPGSAPHGPCAHRDAGATARTTNTAAARLGAAHRATPTITLETLPPELRRQILFATIDLEDLRALVLASPVFYQQYLLDRKPLLGAALTAALGYPSLLAEAYAGQASSSLYPPGVLETNPFLTIQFQYTYRSLRTATTPTILQKACEADLASMVFFYRCVVRPLVTECATRFRKNYGASPELEDLSSTERMRLTRALYRFQLYCNLYVPGRGAERMWLRFQDLEILKGFFGMFTPWEIEEIDCLNHVLLQARGEVTVLGKILRRVPRHKDKNQYMEQAVSARICQVLRWTIQSSRRVLYPSPADQAEARREVSRFTGDREDGPPLAWAVMWQGLYRNRYGSLIPDNLKLWGYVFWDGEWLLSTPVKEAFLETWKAHLPVVRSIIG